MGDRERRGLGWESGVMPRTALGAGSKRGTMPGGSIVL